MIIKNYTDLQNFILLYLKNNKFKIQITNLKIYN